MSCVEEGFGMEQCVKRIVFTILSSCCAVRTKYLPTKLSESGRFRRPSYSCCGLAGLIGRIR